MVIEYNVKKPNIFLIIEILSPIRGNIPEEDE